TPSSGRWPGAGAGLSRQAGRAARVVPGVAVVRKVSSLAVVWSIATGQSARTNRSPGRTRGGEGFAVERGTEDMSRWWKRGAVVAAWLGLGTAVPAQPPMYPSPVGATRMLEPLHYQPDCPPPSLVPGPLNPLMAPAGPPDTLNLPADHTNAFPSAGCLPPE